MYFCIADQRANPLSADELRKTLGGMGFATYLSSKGNVIVDILNHVGILALSRELGAVVEAEISVDGCDVSTQIRIKDWERSE